MPIRINHLLKSHTPRLISNRLPLICKPGDKLIYEGFKQDDLPRFEGDQRFSVGYGSELTCYGWSFGRVKDGETECTINPLHEIFYVFSGELIDNITFKPYKDDGGKPKLKVFSDEVDNPFLRELNLPPECDLRKDLNYFDLDVIEAREAAFESLKQSLFENYKPRYNFRDNDYTGSYEDVNGTFKTINTSIYVAESILMSRVYGKYYWSIGRETDSLPAQAENKTQISATVSFKYQGHRDKKYRDAA